MSYLKGLVHDKNGLVQFLLYIHEYVLSACHVPELTYNIGDNARQQEVLLMLVWTFLLLVSPYHKAIYMRTYHLEGYHSSVTPKLMAFVVIMT